MDLDAVIRLVHGDEIIASNEKGDSFEALERKYAEWLAKNPAG